MAMNPPRLLRAAPASAGYVAGLVATTAVLRRLFEPDAERLLAAVSTDVAHLATVPWLVLPASALVITGTPLWAWALALFVVLVPLERRLGARRTAVVFFCGHVLATLATELPVGWLVVTGRLPESSLSRLDVGISYGFYTALAASAGLLPGRLRWALLVAAAALLARQLATDPDMAAWGHLVALGCGAGWWGAVRGDAPARLAPVAPAARAWRLFGATVEG
ncbi:MAG: hypothetical protein NVSMB13_19600 [Mycobacteriales bacterium]